MALANAEVWFLDPLSLPQILSWLCLAGSALLALHGYSLLKSKGKPKERFEDTTILVQAGAYRFIRHPMYASLLLLGAGVFLKGPSLVNAALLVGLLAFVTMAGRVEEEENLEHFGPAYAEFMRSTKMFIPFIY
jgi:protein-S-isoprenylcysteine O-methyltransferase Ste14